MKNFKRFLTSQYMIFSALLTIKAICVHALLFHDFDIFRAFIWEGCYIFILLGFVELLPQKMKSWTYLIIDAAMTSAFAGIIVYTSYFNTVPTYFALFELGQLSAIDDSVFSLFNPLYLLLYVDIIVLFFFRLSKKLPFPHAMINRRFLGLTVIPSIIVAGIIFVYYKGIYIANPVLAADSKGIINYEMLNLYKNPNADVKPLSKKLTTDQINETIRHIKRQGESYGKKDFGIAKGRNVIIIQMESFENFLLNAKVDGQEITPNLNRLLKQSTYFPHVFQQVGPGMTADAEFMTNTSLFPQAYSPTSLSEGNRNYRSLPKLLGSKGYNTMTFHADQLKFWNRDQLYPALGFKHFYEQPLYGNKDIVGLGPSDDVLYSKGIGILKKSKQPFYAMFVSMSSHHPFKIPDDKKGLALPAAYQSSIVGDYLQAQHYTDASIGRFIDKLKKNHLWKNSVILFYGDHFGLSDEMMNSNDQQLLKNVVGHTYTNADRFNIPFIMTIPGKTHGSVVNMTGGQLDFLPTLTNVLGVPIDNKVVHFGQDLLNSKQNVIGMRYHLPQGSFINQHIVYSPDSDFNDGTAIDEKTGKQAGFKQYKSDYDQVVELENLSDAYVQSLPYMPGTR